MNGQPWVVGVIPHLFRIRLMEKHLNLASVGESPGKLMPSFTSLDLSDPICPEIFNKLWVSTANSNTEIFNTLDADSSYDDCRTLEQYRLALSTKPFHDINNLKASHLSQLRGFLVLWPMKFLEEEEISLTHSVAKELFV